MADYNIDLGHRIHSQDTSILAMGSGRGERIIREAQETELHPNDMNIEEGFSLSKSWKAISIV
jgi:hypothetical protein